MFTPKTDARVLSLTAAAVALALSASTGADAATAQQTINVSAQVNASCSLSTVALNFGVYDPLVTNATADLTAQTDISVTCTNNASTTISLSSGGQATTGAGATRQLTDGAATPHFLTYSLYSDAARGTPWGDGTLAPLLAYTGTGALQPVTIYGKVDKAQSATAGSYTDVITATITF
jgi:spore coat protein U-like protein